MKYPTGIIWWNGKLVPFALIKVVAMRVLNLKHQTNPLRVLVSCTVWSQLSLHDQETKSGLMIEEWEVWSEGRWIDRGLQECKSFNVIWAWAWKLQNLKSRWFCIIQDNLAVFDQTDLWRLWSSRIQVMSLRSLLMEPRHLTLSASLRSQPDILSFDGGSARSECNSNLICSKVDTRPTFN